MNDEKVRVTKNNNKFIEKKDKKINQKPKKPKLPETNEKTSIGNIIWVILLFVILFAVLIALPYISNYR